MTRVWLHPMRLTHTSTINLNGKIPSEDPQHQAESSPWRQMKEEGGHMRLELSQAEQSRRSLKTNQADHFHPEEGPKSTMFQLN